MSAPPLSFGSDVYPGLAKLVEEAGEVAQVAGKLVMTGGERAYFDGTDLHARLEEEIADLLAAAYFVSKYCGINEEKVDRRVTAKLALFEKWRGESRGEGV